MSWALATAGGKDATLALHRARGSGLEVRWALNVFEGSSGLVRFHGTPRGLLEAHVRALGLEPRFDETRPGSSPPDSGTPEPRVGNSESRAATPGPRTFGDALADLLQGLREEGATGVLFGNLHLADIRAWYEERVRAAGLKHREPLWGTPPSEVVQDVVALGFRARVISVNLEMARSEWLGRELDDELVDRFIAAGIDPCGERGEYHTFVYDGPGFRDPVPFQVEGEAEREGHRYLLLS